MTTSLPLTNPCNCEHGSHFADLGGSNHAYLGVPAGDTVAYYVGPVCDACASGHMLGWIVGAKPA